jgi:hypothetical protein
VGYDNALWLIKRVDLPACGVVRESKEDVARGALKLLFVGNKFVVESWFIAFEERRAAGDAGLALEAVLIECCWIAILVNNILGRTDINDADSIGMCMMKEGTTKFCIVEENVGSVVDFLPFGFAYTVHLLMFWSGSFNFNAKIYAFGNEFG